VTEGVLQSGHALRLGVVDMIFEDKLPVAIAMPAATPGPVRVRITTPAATPEMAMVPPGKTTCKFHPKIAGNGCARSAVAFLSRLCDHQAHE